MRFVRQLFTLIAFAACVAISLAAAIEVGRQGLTGRPLLPNADAVEEARLREMLISIDLSEEPPEQQLDVLRRLESRIDRGLGWNVRADTLRRRQRARLEENMLLLTRLWFLSKVDRFFELPEDQRTVWLDAELDKLQARAARMVDSSQRNGLPARGDFFLARPDQLKQAYDQWQAEAGFADKLRVGVFMMAVQQRLEAKGFDRQWRNSRDGRE